MNLLLSNGRGGKGQLQDVTETVFPPPMGGWGWLEELKISIDSTPYLFVVFGGPWFLVVPPLVFFCVSRRTRHWLRQRGYGANWMVW